MDLIGGRFEIEEEAGAGAMARVFRARDVIEGGIVAVKVLHPASAATHVRFSREAALLAKLRHPGIVRYAGHGRTDDGEPYLAMEWLDGVDLERWLERRETTVAEVLVAGRALAEALAVVHDNGVIHRDIKPSNIFLVDGEITRPKLIDFGIARDTTATAGLTGTGNIIGTPLYMAPEQARGAADMDARLDLFALAGVLFRCLTGRPPFVASTAVALLAKIVLEDPPPLTELRSDAPVDLAVLLSRMLEKEPADRPRHAKEVTEALEQIAEAKAPTMVPPPRRLSRNAEQRVVCIVLTGGLDDEATALGSTLTGDDVHRLADGSHLLVFAGPESPSDLAARAVESALALQHADSSVAVATGLVVRDRGAPVGDSIDRAAELLQIADRGVLVDEPTVGLIEGRYAIERMAGHAVVTGRVRRDAGEVRTLLGRPTPFVGRAREVGVVDGFVDESVDEHIARAVIVVGEAGVGKSRLTREVLRRVTDRDHAIGILSARAESVSADVPLALSASALANAAGLDPRAELERQREALTDYLLGRGSPPQDIEFLAAAAGLPPPAPSEAMKAARDNPARMFERVRDAWTAWLRHECDARPTMLVIDDLHWADPPSLQLVEAALRALSDRPFVLFANARPEVRERAAGLLAAGAHELRLDPLRRRASEQLVRHALGEDVPDADVARIVARADGNAFLLEELVRASSAGRMSELPEGVLGVVQLRLDAVDPDARLVLRAASVLGERFGRAAVEALTGPGIAVGSALRELVERELVVPITEEDGEATFAFRHALVRDAAYALLSADDRRLAHALAAETLERGGRVGPLVLAEHYDRGGVDEAAGRCYRLAAIEALRANDLDGALRHAHRALPRAGSDLERGRTHLTIAEAQMWRGDLEAAQQSAASAAELLPEGSAEWFSAVGSAMTAAGQRGANDVVAQWLERAMPIPPDDDAVSTFVVCLSRAASQLVWVGEMDAVERALERVETVAAGRELSPHVRGRWHVAEAYRWLFRNRPDRSREHMRRSADLFATAGATIDHVQSQMLASLVVGLCGQYDVALEGIERSLAAAAEVGSAYLVDWTRWEQAMFTALGGDPESGRQMLAQVSGEIRAAPLFAGSEVVWLGWLAFEAGDYDALERIVEQMENLPFASRFDSSYPAFAGHCARARGRIDEARRLLDDCSELFDAPTFLGDVGYAGWVVTVELALAVDPVEGRRRLSQLATSLIDGASAIEDTDLRHALLTRVPWNARLLALAEEHG